MILPIIGATDKKIREISKPVGKIDKKVQILIRDLIDTLNVQKDPEGVGLAAPQVGKNLRVFVTRYKGENRVVINPKVISKSKVISVKKNKKGKSIMEGCLSLVNYYGPLKRPNEITIEYLDTDGKTTRETFRGFEAQIIQHEIDHLDGILFIDHLLREKKPLYEYSNGEWFKVDLPT